MPILRTLFIIACCGTALAAVVENVAVSTAGAPTNYVVSYDLNIPSGEWYYVDATLSADNGASFPFALDEQPVAAMLTDEPNIPIRVAAQDNSKNINAYFNKGGAQSFSLSVNRTISIPQARIRVLATQMNPYGAVWEKVTAAAPWGARGGYQCLVFNNKIWLISGDKYWSTAKSDVWCSSDGTNWTQVTATAPWCGRHGHQCIIFNNKMWLLGGYADITFSPSNTNDVWCSSDGTNWAQVITAAPWSGRQGHQCVVFNNKIWLLGGNDGSYRNDVWSSGDGTNWTQVTASAQWSGRAAHQCISFNNKIWLVGGGNVDSKTNDVWSSSDGTNWTLVTTAAPWSARSEHQCVVFDDKVWLLGGYSEAHKNDVWLSNDGSNWTLVLSSAPWSARSSQCVIFNNTIFLLGGVGNTTWFSDVWCSPPR